jgi:hypothetical protein
MFLAECSFLLLLYLCCSYLHVQIAELLPLQKKFMDLKAQLELKSYDLKLFEGRAEQNEHHKVCFFFSLTCDLCTKELHLVLIFFSWCNLAW